MKKLILLSVTIGMSLIVIGCGATKSAKYDKFQERQIEIAPGNICSNGGNATLRGIDLNGNGTLDDYEVLNSKSTYGCKGDKGEQGERGPIGATGPIGADGASCYLTNNTPFLSTDDVLTQESGCTNGGTVNTYSCTDDVTYNTYTCNGNDGTNGSNGFNALSNTSNERAGSNCATGGLRIDIGLDINTNNILDNSEITNTSYVCNGNDGTNGSNGFNTLTNLSAEPIGSNCSNGGTRIDVGLDTNRNNILENSEITDTSYACNADGVPPPPSLCVPNDTRPECTSGLWRVKNLQFSDTFGEFYRDETGIILNKSSYVQGFTSAIRFRWRDWNAGSDICRVDMTWANGSFTGGGNSCTDVQGRYSYTSAGWARISGTNSGVNISTLGVISLVNGATHDVANRRICFTSGGTSCVSYNIEWELIP